jgi:ABC-type cobalamin/Fe3+-siderophores transport system ATPase subunit/D-ribose pyranose/furanose isomerase RbsD
MPFRFSIPTNDGPLNIELEPGSSVIFVGANGGGKTRLAVAIEESLGESAHRISAHRALALNPGVAKVSERLALIGLRTGFQHEGAQLAHRVGSRWHNKGAIDLLLDFDFLMQALFAEQHNKAIVTHQKNRAGDHTIADPTNLERLAEIWTRLLPHRNLHIYGDNIEASIAGSGTRYSAADMSDGERAIFYMIGQTLTAANNSMLIIDEPELHVHRAIMSKLWDELEAARPDCGFVFITHDLEFAASRVAKKYVVRDYEPTPMWTVEAVPENTGFNEELTTLILGSRKPILFVEGDGSSLDVAIYRSCFSDWTVMPRGSCEEVIHSVVTLRKNESLTRVTCSGIVDADDYNADESAYLATLGVAVLPVSEIENILLLPPVSRAIVETESYDAAEVNAKIRILQSAIFETLNSPGAIESVVVRYCKRRIDRALKKIDLGKSTTVAGITAEYNKQTSELNIEEIAATAKKTIEEAIEHKNIDTLLAIYDNKQLVALAAKHLKGSTSAKFQAWIMRVLRNNDSPKIVEAFRNVLPTLRPS